jgi:hypothetical protein
MPLKMKREQWTVSKNISEGMRILVSATRRTFPLSLWCLGLFGGKRMMKSVKANTLRKAKDCGGRATGHRPA